MNCFFCNHISKKKCSDWEIAKAVGVGTYFQLLDHAPGMFEAFPDYRNGGNSSSSVFLNPITSFKNEISREYYGGTFLSNRRIGLPIGNITSQPCDENERKIVPKILNVADDKVPYPPNQVSAVILDSGMKMCELKYLLQKYVTVNECDPRILPLVENSSLSYNKPELTPGAMLAVFTILSVIVNVGAVFVIKKMNFM